ncbi:MAG: TSUP family transporter, partial [Angelakisella sp.]
MLDFKVLVIVCPMVFLAGFVDSVAGGGGLISLPAYLFAGLPIHIAYGTNKLSGCCGTTMAVLKYGKSGYINWRDALTAGIGAVVGSWCGAKFTVILSPDVLGRCMLIILPLVAIFLLFKRDFGKTEGDCKLSSGALPLAAVGIGLVIGAYDGFFGPGTGTFLVIAFTALLGQSLTTATGNAKVVNLCSNIAALVAYIPAGKVLWSVGIPAAICGMAGNYLGSKTAIKKGAAFIRPVILVSIGLLFV